MIGRTLGKCEISTIIGSGAMGVVYRGRHTALGVPVAVKTIKPELADHQELVQRFSQEARLAAQLRHPNVVRVYDVGEQDGVHYIVMEYLEGRTLDQIYRDGGLADQRTFFSTFYAIAAGTGEAHRKGIIHRDLKPANVIVTNQGKPVLTDFGIAAALTQDARLTGPGILLGTPAYMAPEAARGEANLNARADVFALGVMMVEVLAGSVPHASDNVLEVLSRRLSEPFPPLRTLNSAIPEPLASVVDRAVSFDAQARQADGWELANDLSAAYQTLFPSGATETEPPAQTGPDRPLLLPPEEAEPIATGADLRYTDLQALLAAAERTSTGFGLVAFHSAGRSDLLLFEADQLAAALRWQDGEMTPVGLEDVLEHQTDDAGAVVDTYAISERYFRAMEAICCRTPTLAGLRMAFVRLDALLAYLQAERASGVLRVQLGGKLGLLVLREGEVRALYGGGVLSGTGDSPATLAQLGSTLGHHPLTRLDFYSLEASALRTQETPAPDRPLELEEASLVAALVEDLFAISAEQLDRAFGLGAGPILAKYFELAAGRHPALLDDVEMDAKHGLPERTLLPQIESLPKTGRRAAVIEAARDLVAERIEAIRAALSSARKQRKVLRTLAQVWQRHRAALAQRDMEAPFAPLFDGLEG